MRLTTIALAFAASVPGSLAAAPAPPEASARRASGCPSQEHRTLALQRFAKTQQRGYEASSRHHDVEAVQQLGASYAHQPHPQLLLSLLEILARSGRTTDARALYQRALTLTAKRQQGDLQRRYQPLVGGTEFPPEGVAEMALEYEQNGGRYFTAGRLGEAQDAFQFAYLLDQGGPSGDRALYNLARLYHLRKLWVEALLLYDRFLGESLDSDLAPTAHRNLADVCTLVESARPVYRRAWFWSLLGVGAAALASGITLAVKLQPPGPEQIMMSHPNLGGHP